MKKRAILTTVVAFLLLDAVIAAGLNAVFTVTYVNAHFRTYTDEGERAAQEVKEALNGYLGTSTTFLDLEDVRATAASDPRFCVVSVRKEYPASVIVELEERRAAFALASADGWDILDDEGVRIGTTDTPDGYVALSGDFAFAYEDGAIAGSYAAELLEMYSVCSELLGEPRANLLSVTLETSGSTATGQFDRFRIATREGVEIVIANPSVAAADKARAAIECYLGLDASDRVCGSINTGVTQATAEYFRSGTSQR